MHQVHAMWVKTVTLQCILQCKLIKKTLYGSAMMQYSSPITYFSLIWVDIFGLGEGRLIVGLGGNNCCTCTTTELFLFINIVPSIWTKGVQKINAYNYLSSGTEHHFEQQCDQRRHFWRQFTSETRQHSVQRTPLPCLSEISTMKQHVHPSQSGDNFSLFRSLPKFNTLLGSIVYLFPKFLKICQKLYKLFCWRWHRKKHDSKVKALPSQTVDEVIHR